MYIGKQKTNQLMMQPNRSMSEKLLELINDRLQKTEQALFQFKLAVEKDPSSKLPQIYYQWLMKFAVNYPTCPQTSRVR